MGAKGMGRPGLKVTTMRLADDVLERADKMADKLGVSRTKYFEDVLARDLERNKKLIAEAQAARVPAPKGESDDIFG